MNRILVDTNILVYAVDEDSIFHSAAEQVVRNSEYSLFTTSKNLSEFLVVLTRGAVAPVPVEDALLLLEDLLENFTVLYPSGSSRKVLEQLLKKYRPRGLKIHDFEIMSIGLDNGIRRVATVNKDDFKAVKEIELIELPKRNDS
ncbi:type II toxin-antitoxin system VapC family toxin [Candidatus Electronema sp. JM]|uniref:type II toxin-antitoxin system VapC family toxin n=1 Tax=Candidatus Electronema sp. JM TaxID=3401571 RepID=UPI003AA82003